MKKILLFVVLVSLLGVSSWATGQREAKTGAPVSLTWLTGVWGNQLDPNGHFAKKVKELFNIDLTINIMPAAQLGQKAQVIVAGGDYPEILMLHNGPNSLYKGWAQQGLFVGLDKYWKDYPDLVKGLPEETTLKPCRVDGKLYMVPILLVPSRFNLTYRQDWLNAVGKKVPATMDEFYEAAKAFTDKDPDKDGKKNTYGFGMDKLGGTTFGIVTAGFGIPGIAGNMYKTPSGEIAPVFLHPRFQEALGFMKRCYAEGILDPDSVTKIYAELEKDFLQGKTGITLGNNSKTSYLEGTLKESIPTGTIAVGDPLKSSDGKQIWQFYSPIWRGNVITQKANSDLKIRKALDLFNWMVGAGDEFRVFGPEGVYWTKRGSNGKPILTGDGEAKWARTGENFYDIMTFLRPLRAESWIDGNLWKNEATVAVQVKAFERYEPFAVYEPGAGITTPTMVEVGATLTQIINAGVFEVIIGKEKPEYLEKVIQEWRAKGGIKMYEEINVESKKQG